MDTSLLDLLRGTNNEESKEYSHVTLYGPHKNWTINDSNYENFWRTYCEIAENPETNKKKLCLAEMPRKYMPIIVDFTLKFHPLNSGNSSEDMYDQDFILSIVYCYQQIIKDTLKISDAGTELICCVLKAETVMEDNLIVCRIRLHFPYCKTVAQIQNRLIRPLALQMFRTTNVISRLRSQPTNDWDDIVDPLTVETPIVMYGSSAGPGIPKYVLEHTFPQVEAEEINESKTRIMEVWETFFPQNHEHALNGIVNLDMFMKKIVRKDEDAEDEDEEDDEDDEENEDDDEEEKKRRINNKVNHDFWLPYFLSIYYLKEITLSKNSPPSLSISSSSSMSRGRISKSPKGSFTEEDPDSPEYLSSVFLGMLDRKRGEEEHFWLDVGKALYNAFDGDERGLEKWQDFSGNYKKFTREECKTAYNNFMNPTLTIKTLAFYAREDSRADYKRWHQEWYFGYLEKALTSTHSDVAEAFRRVYWLDYCCSSLSKNNLYYFNKHIWKKLDSGHLLKTTISGHFITILEGYRLDVVTEIQGSNDKNYKDTAEVQVQKICKLIDKLKNRTYKNAIFSEVCEKFFVDGFENMLDSNCELMGCTNGVIQTLDKKAVFRDGKPEDYVSKSTGVTWKHDMSEKHPSYIKLLSWLTKVFPDKDLLNHVSKLFASCLRGKNADKKFPILTGKGNNSKSMIKKLLDCAFGSYIITIPTGVFTGNKSSGGADPCISRSKSSHIAFVQEPDADTPLRSGTIKEFSGGDSFYTRTLFSEGGEISPMFTLMLMCNSVPIIPACDAAIKKRVMILGFSSYWSENAPKSIEEQYKNKHFLMDPLFEKQIPEMAPAFLYYLVKMFAVYRKEGMIEPLTVKKMNEVYWEENDIYFQYIKENVEKAVDKEGKPDETVFLTLTNAYARFKDWHKEAFGNLKVPDRQIFKNEFENRTTKCLNRHFYGIRLKSPELDSNVPQG